MSEKLVRSALKRRFTVAASLLLAGAIVSCAGGAGSPEKAIRKMVHAYGGQKNVERLQSFVAKGFIKDVASRAVVESFTFDMYRKGELYKHKITKAPRGAITDVIVMYYNGKNNYQWVNGRGTMEVPPMEVGFLRFRFPLVLKWVQEPGRTGEVLPVDKKENVIRVRYKDENAECTLDLDKKSWLLSAVEIKDLTDSTFAYREMYDHYFDLNGIPFPAEFKAALGNSIYYQWLLPTVELRADLPDSLFRVTAEDTAAFVKRAEVPQQPAAR